MKRNFNVNEAVNAQLGQNGFTSVSATSWTGQAHALQVITDTVFTSLTCANSTVASMLNVTIPAGTLILGEVTAFTLSSGLVNAYNA